MPKALDLVRFNRLIDDSGLMDHQKIFVKDVARKCFRKVKLKSGFVHVQQITKKVK